MLPVYTTRFGGMVSLVDIAAGDIINIDFMHPYEPRKTFD